MLNLWSKHSAVNKCSYFFKNFDTKINFVKFLILRLRTIITTIITTITTITTTRTKQQQIWSGEELTAHVREDRGSISMWDQNVLPYYG